MIHNLKSYLTKITFKYVTKIGTCEVEVDFIELTKDGLKKVNVFNYTVLSENYNYCNSAHKKAISIIATELEEVCQCNSWQLWNY